jgi:protoporphyrin/coproporphyrin ferrochelatase
MTAVTGVVLMAYGSPSQLSEIEAYYTDIRRGRPPTSEQLADLTRRYEAIGGLSPLVDRSRAQREALQAALDEQAPGAFAVQLGYKHAAPRIEDAVDDLAAAGVEELVGLVLAPHYSARSVGEYLARLRDGAERHALPVAAIERWGLDDAYLAFEAGAVLHELQQLPERTKVVFTAHSLPARILDDGDPYPDEVRASAEAIAGRVGLAQWAGWCVAWQSAGRTPEPWLGPDILDVITDLAAAPGAEGVLVCACGFVADHLEVLYDLDIAGRRHAARLGLAFSRTACVNDDPAVLAELAARVRATAGR